MAGFVRVSLRKRLFTLLALSLVALGMTARHASAIVITAVSPGSGTWRGAFGTPQTGRGGISQAALLAIADAAGDYWESLILDPFAMNIEVGFTDEIGGATAASGRGRNGGSPGLIAVTSRFPFFVDPTPFDNSEYGGTVTTFADLGGGLLNTAFGFTEQLEPGIDLFTILLHEIGHTLGVDLNMPQTGLIVPSPLPFAGTLLPAHFDDVRLRFTGHIDVPGALMSPNAGGVADVGVGRSLPSDADIVAVATGGRFRDIRLNQIVPVDEPGALTLLLAACAVVVAFRR
jgi:hypothetical protein